MGKSRKKQVSKQLEGYNKQDEGGTNSPAKNDPAQLIVTGSERIIHCLRSLKADINTVDLTRFCQMYNETYGQPLRKHITDIFGVKKCPQIKTFIQKHLADTVEVLDIVQNAHIGFRLLLPTPSTSSTRESSDDKLVLTAAETMDASDALSTTKKLDSEENDYKTAAIRPGGIDTVTQKDVRTEVKLELEPKNDYDDLESPPPKKKKKLRVGKNRKNAISSNNADDKLSCNSFKSMPISSQDSYDSDGSSDSSLLVVVDVDEENKWDGGINHRPLTKAQKSALKEVTVIDEDVFGETSDDGETDQRNANHVNLRHWQTRQESKAEAMNSSITMSNNFCPMPYYYHLSIFPPEIHPQDSRPQQGFRNRKLNICSTRYEDLKPIYNETFTFSRPQGTLGDCISWALGKVVISKRITTRHLTLLNVWKRSRPHSGTFTQQPSLGTKNDDERKEILIPLEENDLIESGVHYVAHYFVNNFELAYFLRPWCVMHVDTSRKNSRQKTALLYSVRNAQRQRPNNALIQGKLNNSFQGIVSSGRRMPWQQNYRKTLTSPQIIGQTNGFQFRPMPPLLPYDNNSAAVSAQQDNNSRQKTLELFPLSGTNIGNCGQPLPPPSIAGRGISMMTRSMAAKNDYAYNFRHLQSSTSTLQAPFITPTSLPRTFQHHQKGLYSWRHHNYYNCPPPATLPSYHMPFIERIKPLPYGHRPRSFNQLSTPCSRMYQQPTKQQHEQHVSATPTAYADSCWHWQQQSVEMQNHSEQQIQSQTQPTTKEFMPRQLIPTASVERRTSSTFSAQLSEIFRPVTSSSFAVNAAHAVADCERQNRCDVRKRPFPF